MSVSVNLRVEKYPVSLISVWQYIRFYKFPIGRDIQHLCYIIKNFSFFFLSVDFVVTTEAVVLCSLNILPGSPIICEDEYLDKAINR